MVSVMDGVWLSDRVGGGGEVVRVSELLTVVEWVNDTATVFVVMTVAEVDRVSGDVQLFEIVRDGDVVRVREMVVDTLMVAVGVGGGVTVTVAVPDAGGDAVGPDTDAVADRRRVNEMEVDTVGIGGVLWLNDTVSLADR